MSIGSASQQRSGSSEGTLRVAALASDRDWIRGGGRGAVVCALLAALAMRGDEVHPTSASMTFEQLSQIQISSLSKWEERWAEAAAAVHVVTGDDIRRSGVRSFAEALRLAPGTDVARINSQRYAVSIRGFNGEYANKLLVMQDGRSLYTPQFAGTFWDAQDLMLEDVDRIEVIRGPGGTTWGINAVNGVINILSKDAGDTQGLLVTGGGGTSERAFGGVRQGGRLGEHTYYRVYAQSFYRGESEWPDGSGAGDDWTQARLGFRVDSTPTEADHWTVQGDGYGGELLQYAGGVADQFVSAGGNLLGRWTHTFSESSELQVQLYYDCVRRDSLPATANSDTGDIEASHHFGLGERQRISWGVHYRYVQNEAQGHGGHVYDPVRRGLQTAGIFVEDQFTVVPDRLRVSAGSKFEYNSFTHWEVLPNARLSYTPSSHTTLWAAVSRGVQTTSISDHDLTHNIPGAVGFRSLPNPDRLPEELWAYELGVRAQVLEQLSLDLAGFFNQYDNLATYESTFEPTPPTVVVTPSNEMYGETYGFEASALWQATGWWRWRLTYTLLLADMHLRAGTTDTTADTQVEGRSPQQQVMLWSSMDLGGDWECDAIGRYVDEIQVPQVGAYLSLDLRVAWRPRPDLELAVVGQNLLDDRHPEHGRSPGFPQLSEVPRGVYGKVTWSY